MKYHNKEFDRIHPHTLLHISDHSSAAVPYHTRFPNFPEPLCTLLQKPLPDH